MPAREIFNLVAAEFVSVNNLRGLVDGQISAIDAEPSHAVKIVAVLNHRERLGVENVHSAKLVGGDGKKFVLSVAQKKFFRPADVRTTFFVERTEKTSEDAISRNHQLLSAVNDTFDG